MSHLDPVSVCLRKKALCIVLDKWCTVFMQHLDCQHRQTMQGSYKMSIFPLLMVVCGLLSQLDVSTGELLSEYLWTNTKKYHIAALESPYIQGLKKDTLDPTDFGVYNIQDAIYLYRETECVNIAASRTTDKIVKTFLQARAESYKTEWVSAFKTWHIDRPDGIVLGEACQNYVNHLYDVATTKDPIYFVVAMIPCVKLWPWLGQQIDGSSENFGVYNKWVNANLDPNYTGYKKYDDLIDAAYLNGSMTKEEALDVYSGSMKGEAAFFNSVSNLKKPKHDEF